MQSFVNIVVHWFANSKHRRLRQANLLPVEAVRPPFHPLRGSAKAVGLYNAPKATAVESQRLLMPAPLVGPHVAPKRVFAGVAVQR